MVGGVVADAGVGRKSGCFWFDQVVWPVGVVRSRVGWFGAVVGSVGRGALAGSVGWSGGYI